MTEERAADVIRRTARRVGATGEDLDRVLGALFALPRDTAARAASKVSEGIPLSPADKARIRELIRTGADTAVIVSEVGCSVQAVAGVRVGVVSAARKARRITAERSPGIEAAS